MSGLHYTLSGDPRHPALLFLHGFMGSAADWDGVVSRLEGSYHCLSVDLPGHGSSLGLPPETYTADGMARALRGLLGEIGLRRPAVVGYSMGGRLVLYLALRYPESCGSLFLESASPGLPTEEERAARRELDKQWAQRLETGDLRGFLEDWYRQPLFDTLARDEPLLQRTIEARMENEPRELARSLRGFGTGTQPSLWEELPGLRVPALAVAGEEDARFVRIAGRMAEASGKLRAAAVPGAGHNAHAEAPGAYLGLLGEFLRRLE